MSKLITGNQSQSVANQLKKVLETNPSLSLEIREDEQDYYHVLFIEAILNKMSLETSYKVSRQVFDKNAWAVVSKNKVQLGNMKIVILHNPEDLSLEEVESVDSEKEIPEIPETPTKTRAKELRRKLIEEAVSLGYEGKKTEANSVFEEYIKANRIEL